MMTFPGQSELIEEYNALCAKGFGLKKHAGLTFHHILPRCEWPEHKDNPCNWTWLSFEDHWLAHYLLWKATDLPKYASAFWFICVYGMKNRGMSLPANEYDKLKHDVAVYRAAKRKERSNERLKEFKKAIDAKSRDRSEEMH